MTIQELREKRSKAWDTARDFLDSKRNESGLLSEEDSTTYDAMEQQIVAYGKEIQRLERQAQIEAEMNKPTSTPIQNKPNASTHSDTKTGIASDAYRTAFWNSIRNRNFYDVRNDLQVGTDTEGGYLVPGEFERKLVEALTEENIFRQLATVIKLPPVIERFPSLLLRAKLPGWTRKTHISCRMIPLDRLLLARTRWEQRSRSLKNC